MAKVKPVVRKRFEAIFSCWLYCDDPLDVGAVGSWEGFEPLDGAFTPSIWWAALDVGLARLKCGKLRELVSECEQSQLGAVRFAQQFICELPDVHLVASVRRSSVELFLELKGGAGTATLQLTLPYRVRQDQPFPGERQLQLAADDRYLTWLLPKLSEWKLDTLRWRRLLADGTRDGLSGCSVLSRMIK